MRTLTVMLRTTHAAGSSQVAWDFCCEGRALQCLVLTCRRARSLQLDKHMVVGKSVLSNTGGISDSMMAELFEAVRPFLMDCIAINMLSAIRPLHNL